MVNMGYVELINPGRHLALEVPYLALHFLEQGSFAYGEQKRIDPVQLEMLLRPTVLIGVTANEVTLRWAGLAGRTYQLYTAPDIQGPWTPGTVFQGNNSDLTFTEATALEAPQKFYKIVSW
jgi:hypothetical protein